MTPPDKKLLARLPRTFVPALNDQIGRWELLFPCEQRVIRDQVEYLGRLPAREFDELFRSVKQLEARMDLPSWGPARSRITVSDTSLLVRSPYYPQWRVEVEKVFERINSGIEATQPQARLNRLLVCVLPAGLPVNGELPWPRLAREGRRVKLKTTFGEAQPELIRTLASHCARSLETIERMWALEAGGSIARAVGADATGLTVLSFDALAPVRREFLRRLNQIRKDLRSLDATYDDLRHMKLEGFLEPALARHPQIPAYIRDLFLSGNGAVLFGNSFVQWGAAEALRRAQPQAVFCAFGIRKRLKPFSGLVLFEDQTRANPVPEQDDPAASLEDGRILADYVRLAAERLAAYQGRTAGIFAVAELQEVWVLGPLALPEAPTGGIAPSEFAAALGAWLGEQPSAA